MNEITESNTNAIICLDIRTKDARAAVADVGGTAGDRGAVTMGGGDSDHDGEDEEGGGLGAGVSKGAGLGAGASAGAGGGSAGCKRRRLAGRTKAGGATGEGVASMCRPRTSHTSSPLDL